MTGLLQVRADLVQARRNRTLIRVRRSLESGWATGYVVEVGPRLFALLVVSDLIVFNGFQVFRICDVASLDLPDPHASFVETALRLRAAVAPVAPVLDLADLASLLVSAGARFPLLTIHQESEDPEVCYVGTVRRVEGETLSLRTVSPDGEWHDEAEVLSLSAITRVDFGGMYEEALSLVAGAGSRVEMDPRTIASAKKELSASAEAFLDALRPYQRVLPHGEFHRVAEATRGVADCIREDPIDREALDILLVLLHTANAWALDPDGMLRRNKLITDEDQRLMREWLRVLSQVLGRLVAGAELEKAFKRYAELRERDGEAG